MEGEVAMQLKDIMTRDVEVIYPDTSLQEAAEKMRSLDVGSLPITDGGKVVGILTDRDITVRATAKGNNPMLSTVREAMSADVVCGREDQNVEEAARLMEEKQIRRLIVVNRDQELVGVVSLGDLAVGTDNERLAGQTLEGVSEPAKPRR
jgi:CBS domain-containing protein